MPGAGKNVSGDPDDATAPRETSTDHIRLHASSVSLNGRAALIRGRSGAGKSDLVLRCLAVTAPALFTGTPRLVADDQVVVTRLGDALRLTAPAPLRGKLEVRGLGIIALAPELSATAALVCDLVEPGGVERLPDPWPTADILGVRLPVLRLAPFEASAPIKLLAALAMPQMLTIPRKD